MQYAQYVAYFHSKNFQGVEYHFTHLEPISTKVALNATATKHVELHVIFGCHCFTEEFDPNTHMDHDRYTFRGELRAFNVLRYECSLQLPVVLPSLLKGRIHRANDSLTYVAHIIASTSQGLQPYSIFFNLEIDKEKPSPALKMYIKSAYLKPLVAKSNAQTWRFISLAGEMTGEFIKVTKPRPTKKVP